MQISSRFTIAIHMLACMHTFEQEYKITSDFLAKSVNVNPVIIRNILTQLKDAGFIRVMRGVGGASIIKPLDDITLFDIYQAVECIEHNTLFHFHEKPNQDCPIGKNIHFILDDKLDRVQNAMEKELNSITLQDIIHDTNKYIKLQGL